MYAVEPHNVKDCYEGACLYLAHAIRIVTHLGLTREVARLKKRAKRSMPFIIINSGTSDASRADDEGKGVGRWNSCSGHSA